MCYCWVPGGHKASLTQQKHLSLILWVVPVRVKRPRLRCQGGNPGPFLRRTWSVAAGKWSFLPSRESSKNSPRRKQKDGIPRILWAFSGYRLKWRLCFQQSAQQPSFKEWTCIRKYLQRDWKCLQINENLDCKKIVLHQSVSACISKFRCVSQSFICGCFSVWHLHACQKFEIRFSYGQPWWGRKLVSEPQEIKGHIWFYNSEVQVCNDRLATSMNSVQEALNSSNLRVLLPDMPVRLGL